MQHTLYRFDLMAKYLYIKYKNIDFYRELYHKHLITFNNCYEYPGTKKNIDDFITSFNDLIEDMKTNGYNNNHPIPLYNNKITNGAHRLMISYFYNIQPIFTNTTINENTEYNYDFFINRKGNPPLNPIYADTMALEYLNINKNIRAIVLFPSINRSKLKKCLDLIKQYGYIYYRKDIELNDNGLSNLIKELYRGEEWIGGIFPKGINPGGKYNFCKGPGNIILLLVHMNDNNKCIELKQKCREIFNIGKHSIHMTDYSKDTFRVGSSLLNENSIHYLNHTNNDISENTKKLLIDYFDKIGEVNEDYCLTSSLILEMYHLRQARDIDYLHKNNEKLSLDKTGVHDGKWLTYYYIEKEDMIYNPENYFYFNGFKFVTLNVIKKMKENRGETKDINDIKLIKQIIN